MSNSTPPTHRGANCQAHSELEVNYQLEFCWLFDRDVGRFLSFENAGALSNARLTYPLIADHAVSRSGTQNGDAQKAAFGRM
jgi:hypothetical protein